MSSASFLRHLIVQPAPLSILCDLIPSLDTGTSGSRITMAFSLVNPVSQPVPRRYASPGNPIETAHNQGSWFTDMSFPAVILSVGPRIEAATTIDFLSNKAQSWWQWMYNGLGAAPGYSQNAFLPAQAAVNQALLEEFQLPIPGANQTLRQMRLNRFPFPAYKGNTFALVIKGVLPLFLVLALLITAILIAKSVVDEKESRLTETFKMMGITAFTQWAAWFLQYTFFLSISVSTSVLLLKVLLVHHS